MGGPQNVIETGIIRGLIFIARRDTLNSEGLYVPQKPTRSDPSAKNDTGEFGKFTNFMQRLVAVPHSEIKAKLDAEKRVKQERKKKPSASRASSDPTV